MTRQRAYQLRKKELGCCQICGAYSGGLSRCTRHFIKDKARKRLLAKAWEEGKPGRPPTRTN